MKKFSTLLRMDLVLRMALGSLAAISLSSCGGGGGGGGDFIGAALSSIQLSPDRIDTGDRTQVRIDLQEVHRNGIALKVRIPDGLFYVPSSALLTIDGDEENASDISPTVNEGDAKKHVVYLVFYLARSEFNEDGSGTVTFQLEGKDEVKDGLIGVDPDVDDPDISNGVEFNIDTPEFAAEDEASINVVS